MLKSTKAYLKHAQVFKQFRMSVGRQVFRQMQGEQFQTFMTNLDAQQPKLEERWALVLEEHYSNADLAYLAKIHSSKRGKSLMKKYMQAMNPMMDVTEMILGQM